MPLGALGCATLLALGGCPLPGGRTCNQGCSNVPQAISKITSDRLGDLNPDDIQILADLAVQYADVNLPPVTDEQAAAAVTFLADNGVSTLAELQALIRQAEADPNSVVISPDVQAVIDQIVANPDAYIGAAGDLETNLSL